MSDFASPFEVLHPPASFSYATEEAQMTRETTLVQIGGTSRQEVTNNNGNGFHNSTQRLTADQFALRADYKEIHSSFEQLVVRVASTNRRSYTSPISSVLESSTWSNKVRPGRIRTTACANRRSHNSPISSVLESSTWSNKVRPGRIRTTACANRRSHNSPISSVLESSTWSNKVRPGRIRTTACA
ncbi:hypothetical protein AVEN_12331-1 [Araneus ventricosus]|uniref:Uncharacterized protein n=1 Tax=Araneus ventricosus TaxID=182803 RepID=A0A4Y2KXG3_ARAVE|nr:hypothetical protein AVEN_12331-1 [Araneus ventricosus]